MSDVDHRTAIRDTPKLAANELAPRPARIIILEDDALTRQGLREALESAGYLTCADERGAAILEHLSAFEPDLILLDMLLPEMDGFEFLARLQTHPAGARVAVVILSNLAASLVDCIDPDAAKAIGVAAILPKSLPRHTARSPGSTPGT
jgi:CheY-like chemotaxis protein